MLRVLVVWLGTLYVASMFARSNFTMAALLCLWKEPRLVAGVETKIDCASSSGNPITGLNIGSMNN